MGRKIILRREGENSGQILEEIQAHDEAQLQEQLKENPDLLPIEEYELSGPLMVVGRETTLPSGSVDLICLTMAGEVLIVEFKTGPQNPDFRHTLAQLLDYGSHLWGMEYEVFEETVARNYFNSDRCPAGSPVKRKPSLEAGAKAIWTDLSDDEYLEFKGNLTKKLTDGRFRYLAVAQRFTEPMLRTIEYLNAKIQGAQFYAIELVRFTGGTISAFEARTVLKPQRTSGIPTLTIDRQGFLESLDNVEYRVAVRDFLEAAEGLDLRLVWGSQGMSIRISVPEKSDGLSIGWLFPPGSVGWIGTNDVSLGYDRETATKYTPSVLPMLETYSKNLSSILGAKKISTARLEAYRFVPDVFIARRDELVETISNLVKNVAGG
jgi:hypothetical protein